MLLKHTTKCLIVSEAGEWLCFLFTSFQWFFHSSNRIPKLLWNGRRRKQKRQLWICRRSDEKVRNTQYKVTFEKNISSFCASLYCIIPQFVGFQIFCSRPVAQNTASMNKSHNLVKYQITDERNDCERHIEPFCTCGRATVRYILWLLFVTMATRN